MYSLYSKLEAEYQNYKTYDINDICEKNDITLCPEWIPRGENQMADDLSRCGDCVDWSVMGSSHDGQIRITVQYET